MRVMRGERFFTVDVASDGEGLVSHAGAGLLAETADCVGLTRALSEALASVRERRGRHDPGRVIRDLAVMLADGGDCLSVCLTCAEPLFGAVASNTTAFRLIDRIATEPGLLDALRAARAQARARAWEFGARPAELMIDVDATLIGAHSEKEGAAVSRAAMATSAGARCSCATAKVTSAVKSAWTTGALNTMPMCSSPLRGWKWAILTVRAGERRAPAV